MRPIEGPKKRLRPALPALGALVLLAVMANAAAARPPEVGAEVPDLTLTALAGSDQTLSDRDGPTVLVFFRGVW